MANSNRKQSFLHGAALLAAATVIVKIIGAIYKIPLRSIIGDAGFGYFNTAYDIYSVLLMISTAGLPVAMSRMIAEANSLGHYGQVRRTYKTAMYLFVLLGGLGTLLMTGFSKPLANFMNSPGSWAAIAALGPASVLLCITSAFRGFFQGQGNMRPTSISQVLEAVCKLVIGLGLALYIKRSLDDVPLAAGGAILGVTIGCLMALLYMLGAFRVASGEMPSGGGPVMSWRDTAKGLLAIAIPITIGSAGLQIITLIDAKVVMGRLLDACRMSQAAADDLKGIYNFAQTIFNLPCAFVTPITVSIIPAITERLTLRNMRGVRQTEEASVRVMGLLTMPCAVGLTVLSRPIMGMLGGYSGENLTVAGRLLATLGPCVLFNSVVLLTNAIMQAHGYVYLPVVNMFAGGLVKILVNFLLVGSPSINIQGAPIGTLCCYLCITVLNLFTMRRVLRHAPAVGRSLLPPLAASVLMGGATFVLWKLVSAVTSSNLIQCAVPILGAAAVYALLVIKLRVITYEDCMLLPKGEQIARLLRIR